MPKNKEAILKQIDHLAKQVAELRESVADLREDTGKGIALGDPRSGKVDHDPLTEAEVADRLRVSVMTVSRWVTNGELAAYRFGRRVMIRRADLDRFIESHRNEATH